jgi:hypothetical protein
MTITISMIRFDFVYFFLNGKFNIEYIVYIEWR